MVSLRMCKQLAVYGTTVSHAHTALAHSPNCGIVQQRRPHWYGVVHGFVPGVYKNWANIAAQVNEFLGNGFQIFSNYEEALQLVEEGIRAFQTRP